MRQRWRRGVSLIEALMAGWIACAILSVAYHWVAFSLEVMARDARAASSDAERDALVSVIQEDFGCASRLMPDLAGRGFAIERPSEASVSGRGAPDIVVYDCEPRPEGPVLVRTEFRGAVGPPFVRRLSAGVGGCRASLTGSQWRVVVTWPQPSGGLAEVLAVDVRSRVRIGE